jgi:flagellar protein FlgJ
MSGATKPAAFYADFGGLAQLKGAAQNQDPKAAREAARQFESLFTQMMLKSMRQANASLPGGDSMMDNDQSDMYRDMFDNQLSMQLSKGRGLGLADMLVRQLTQGGVATSATPATAAALKMPVAPPSNQLVQPLTTQLPAQSNNALDRSHRPPTNAPLTSVKAIPSDDVAVSNRDEAAAAMRKYLDEIWPQNPATEDDRAQVKDLAPATPISSVESRKLAPTASDGNVQAIAKADASSVSASSAVARPLATTAAEFVQKMWPHAQAAARELGVDAKTLIAHAALETGWGKFVPCNSDGTCSFNMFGIKAGGRWQGNTVAVNTLEYQDGVAVKQRASFRAYDSPADSFRDYAAFIKNSPRYASAVGAGDDAAAFATALQQGGYATDPNYADKLTSVASRLGALAPTHTGTAPLKVEDTRPLSTGRSVSVGEAT